QPLSCSLRQELTCSSVQRCSLPAPASSRPGICDSQVATAHAIHKAQRFLRIRSGHPAPIVPSLLKVRSVWSSPVQSAVSGHLYCPQSLVISCTVSAVSGHPLYYVRSLWSSPVQCPQSLVISPVLCPQSLFIPCAVSTVSGHPLCCVRSLWSSPVLCLQSLVIP
ncbi:unnamed protein product, partial [Staurois parvus]